jgi:DHA2 family multidrug resistance protein
MQDQQQPQPLSGAPMWLAGFGLALANFVVILDTTITNVSVPHIAGGLAVSPAQGTWTITSYAVAEAITVPLSGWLSARFGTLRTLVWALLGFGLFSVLCGLSRTIEMLVVLRVLQGFCGGPMMPMTQTLMLRVFPPDKMGLANGLWGVTAISAPILGPLAGGMIVDNLDWPWIFFINLPVVGVCYLAVTGLLRKFETQTRKERIDITGMVLLVLFAGSLQLVLDLGREHDWFASGLIVTLAVVSAVAFAVFIAWELTDSHPVVDLRVLRHRSLAVGLPVLAIGFGSMMAMLVLIPLWLQSVVGYTASSAGQLMAMQGVFAVLLSPVAAVLMQKVDMRWPITAGLVITLATAIMRMGWTGDADFWTFATPQLIQGVGMPFFFIGVMTMALVGVPQRDIAMAAGLLNFLRTVAGAAGTALSTSAWDNATRATRGELVGTLNGVNQMTAQMAGGREIGLAVVERLVEEQAATIGSAHVFALTAVAIAVTTALVWLMPRTVAQGTAGIPAAH